MHPFKEYINLLEASGAGSIADAKGKAFELELGKHLHPEGKYPEHHNDESGRSPEVVSSQLRSKLGHEGYEKISSDAKKSAQEYMQKTGHKPVKVHWTSVEGQVSKTTGKKDEGNQSDLVIEHSKKQQSGNKHGGISAKYGSAPGARSSGMKDLATMSGMNHEHMQKMLDAHHEAVHNIMSPHITGTSNKQRHTEFKEAASGAKGAKAKTAAELANKTSIEHRTGIAKHLASHFSNLAANDHEAMTNVVRKLTASHGTETPMIKIHHNPKTGKTDISNPKEDFDRAMSNVSHFSVEHRGTYVHIHAHDKNGKRHPIVKISIKNKSSSPYTNTLGSASLGSGIKNLSK